MIYCNLIVAFLMTFTCYSIFPLAVLLHMKHFFQNSVKQVIHQQINSLTVQIFYNERRTIIEKNKLVLKKYPCALDKLTSLDSYCAGRGKQETN